MRVSGIVSGLVLAVAFSAAQAGQAGPDVRYTPDPLPWDVDPGKTAVLVIDAQKIYNPDYGALACPNFDASMVNVNRLTEAARENDIPVFIIRHVYDEDGGNCGRLCDFSPLGSPLWELWREDNETSELDPSLETKRGDRYFEKAVYSSFTHRVRRALKRQKIDTVIVTGFMTQFCAVTTTRHGHDLGYKVLYVSDATDGPNFLPGQADDVADIPIGDTKAVLHTWLSVGVADVIDTDTAINRIQGIQGE